MVQEIPDSKQPADARTRAGVGFVEFVILMASLTSIVAFSIDIILPALPDIGHEYRLANDNERQLVVVAFTLAFGITQLFFGPLADRFGRKSLMIGSLLFYAASSLAASFAPSFEILLLTRVCQAIGASGVRITTSAIIRDCFEGREMARVMSYIFTTFMIVPIFAPMIGQAILFIAEWPWIFVFLGVGSIAIAAWSSRRIKETLEPENRRNLTLASIGQAAAEIATDRIAAGYSIASTLFFGALFSFVVSVQQIYDTIYGLGAWFAIAFAGNAVGMGIANFMNARLVRQIGMRRMSHGSMVCFVGFSAALFLLSRLGTPPFAATFLLLAGAMMSFGLVAGNFNSIAMQPLGHIAGTATSVIGTLTFTGGALLGGFVGQAFDGTVGPLSTAFLTFGALSLLAVLITERGHLFGAESG